MSLSTQTILQFYGQQKDGAVFVETQGSLAFGNSSQALSGLVMDGRCSGKFSVTPDWLDIPLHLGNKA